MSILPHLPISTHIGELSPFGAHQADPFILFILNMEDSVLYSLEGIPSSSGQGAGGATGDRPALQMPIPFFSCSKASATGGRAWAVENELSPWFCRWWAVCPQSSHFPLFCILENPPKANDLTQLVNLWSFCDPMNLHSLAAIVSVFPGRFSVFRMLLPRVQLPFPPPGPWQPGVGETLSPLTTPPLTAIGAPRAVLEVQSPKQWGSKSIKPRVRWREGHALMLAQLLTFKENSR